MKLIVAFAVILAVVVSSTQAQNYYRYFSGFGPYSPVAPVRQQASASGYRDPRTNTGPIVFPPSPPGNPLETSGVIVGASGYGFVPPNAAWFTYWY